MNELLEQAKQRIGEELRRIAKEEPIGDLRCGAPSWDEKVLSRVVLEEHFGDEVDEVADRLEEARSEEANLLLEVTLQALHDETVTWFAWTFPGDVTAYLVEAWGGETEIFAIDPEGYSEERAARYLSQYIRSVYMTTGSGTVNLEVSPIHVEIHLQVRTEELDHLKNAADA